jgi:hypothetical protein
MGLHGCKPRSKPLLQKIHRKQRLNYAKCYISEPLSFFNKILWTDETNIQLFPNNGPLYVWRPSGKTYDDKYTMPTIKHGGGSIMILGFCSSAGPGTSAS